MLSRCPSNRGRPTERIRLPARSPDLNGYAERWIRSLRQECLDRIIILNEAHLHWVLQEYVRYYNERRPHRALGLHVPAGPRYYPTEGEVACRRVLGGLVNDYYRKAACAFPFQRAPRAVLLAG